MSDSEPSDSQVLTSAVLRLTDIVERQEATLARIEARVESTEARVENLARSTGTRAAGHSGEIAALRTEITDIRVSLAIPPSAPTPALPSARGPGGPPGAPARSAGRYSSATGEQTLIGVAPPANPAKRGV